MKMSCQSWSSVEVTYVHPPQVSVRKMPTPATNFGSVEFGRRVKIYQRPTNTKRGPEQLVSLIHTSNVFIRNRTRCQSDEQHEDGALRIFVSNGRRDRGKPFVRIALSRLLVCLNASETSLTNVVFVLHDFVIV